MDESGWGNQQSKCRLRLDFHLNHTLGMNRSEVVSFLYQRLRDETEHQQRLARSAAAYARIPETSTERALSDISVSLLGA